MQHIEFSTYPVKKVIASDNAHPNCSQPFPIDTVMKIWRNNPNGWPPARFAYEKRRAMNRYTFIMLEHLLISFVFPLAFSFPGEVGNIFDFQGKKEPAGRSEKEGEGKQRGEHWKRETIRRIFAPQHLTPVSRMTQPSYPHSFLWFSFSLHHTCFNFCPEPKPRANLYLHLFCRRSRLKMTRENFKVWKVLLNSNYRSFPLTFLHKFCCSFKIDLI